MQITLVSVGPVVLLAQCDVSNPLNSYRESVVLVDRGTDYEPYVVWRLQEEPIAASTMGTKHDLIRLHAFNGQYYNDLAAALGRFVRRSELLDRADKEVV